MALRFRKSFKLAPGVRMNVSTSGMSWTLGPRGASVSIGKRGTYLNAGLPGTGLSSRIPLSRPGSQSAPKYAQRQTVTIPLTLAISDEGVIRYLDSQGLPVSEAMVTQARKQHGPAIRELLEQKCNHLNRAIETLAELHLDTPSPHDRPVFVPLPLQAAEPTSPIPVKPGMFDWLLPARQRATASENDRRHAEYARAQERFELDKEIHRASNQALRMLHSAAMAGNPEQMQLVLEQRLNEIVWPKETSVALEVSDDGTSLSLDVDLPEVEHMPTKRATLAARSWELVLRDAGEQQTRRLYMQHVHAIGFRLIGETFAALPTVDAVIFSGYSQRPDRASGYVNDEYLYSVRVRRDQWSTLNFNSLDRLDVTEALAQFDIQRKMSATGIFKPVSPLEM